jgi:hypothetical protein
MAIFHLPDAVLSRVIRPICGFSLGFQVQDGVVVLNPLSVAVASDWKRNVSDLRMRFPTWTFEDKLSQ